MSRLARADGASVSWTTFAPRENPDFARSGLPHRYPALVRDGRPGAGSTTLPVFIRRSSPEQLPTILAAAM